MIAASVRMSYSQTEKEARTVMAGRVEWWDERQVTSRAACPPNH